MRLTTTRDDALTTVSCLLIGDSGIGKTTSLRTLPPDKTLIAVGERGAIPLRKDDYPALPFETWADIQELYGYFAAPDKIADKGIKTVIETTRILAIDSLSVIHDLCIKDIVTVARPALCEDRSKGKTAKPQGVYEEQMTLEDWGLYRTRMLRLTAAFARLPVHVIFTVLAGYNENRQTGAVMRGPGLSGKTAFEIPASFDEVLFMIASKDGDGKDTRVWQTFNDGQIVAKDASGVLDPYEPTDWTALFKKILGTKKETK